MSLVNRLREFFRPSSPALRNKPNGMAWIKPYGQAYGADAIAGQIVTTVQVAADGMWVVQPAPSYVLTDGITYEGRCYAAGARVRVVAIHDGLLVPLKDPGYGERTQETMFQPRLLARSKESA